MIKRRASGMACDLVDSYGWFRRPRGFFAGEWQYSPSWIELVGTTAETMGRITAAGDQCRVSLSLPRIIALVRSRYPRRGGPSRH